MSRSSGSDFEVFLYTTRINHTLRVFGAAAVILGFFCALAGCGGSDDATVPLPSPSTSTSPTPDASPTPSPFPSFAPITTNRLRLTYTGTEGTEADLTPVDTSNFACTLTPAGLALSVRDGTNQFVLNVTYAHGVPATGDYPLTPVGVEDNGRAYARYSRSSTITPGEGGSEFYPPATPSGSIEILSVSEHDVRLRVKNVVLRNGIHSSDTITANGEVEFDRANAGPVHTAFATGKSSVTFGNATGANADTRPMAYGIGRAGDDHGTFFIPPYYNVFTVYTKDAQGNRRTLEVTTFPNSPATPARILYREEDYRSDPDDRSGTRLWSSEYSPVRSGTVEVLEEGQGRFRVRLKDVLLTAGDDPLYSGPKLNYGTGTLTVSGEAESFFVNDFS